MMEWRMNDTSIEKNTIISPFYLNAYRFDSVRHGFEFCRCGPSHSKGGHRGLPPYTTIAHDGEASLPHCWLSGAEANKGGRTEG